MIKFRIKTVLSGVATLLVFGATAQETQTIKEVPAITIGKSPIPQEIKSSTPPETEKLTVDTVEQQVTYLQSSSMTVVDKRDSLVYNIIPASDEVISQRLAGLENIMPMPYNSHVQKYIDYFLFKRPSFVREMLERKERYFPVFEKYLVKYNIPDEMKYLSLLESGLNPKAKSHASAVGMWQFMSPTGREMGLTINGYVDERMDVEKSTDASFRYLTKLHNRFGDWELALAAYNTGPGRISRAIRKSGKTDYWALHNYIHRDTRAYVPQWAALNYLMNYAAEHGIFPDYDKVEYPIQTEPLLVNGYLNLETFAKLNYLSLSELLDVNPHLTEVEIPSYAKNVELNFPTIRYAHFENNKVCIMDSSAKLPPAKVYELDGRPYHIEYVSQKKYHRVRRGDNLGKIASNYGVRVSDLKRWNNLRSSKIMSGQRLAIHVRKANKIFHEESSISNDTETVVAQNTSNQPTAIAARSNVKVASASREVTTATNEVIAKPQYVSKTVKRIHSVRRGETLGTIAAKHGVSLSKMKQWNNIRNANSIQYGQRLVYYTKVSEKVYNESANSSGQTIVYTVQRGDTLWSIAKRYPSLSINDIKQLNSLSSNTVKVGQKLKLKKA